MAEQDHQPPLQLEYGVPEPREGASRVVAKALLILGGVFVSLLTESACLFVWGIANFDFGEGQPRPLVWKAPSICSAIGFGFLCLVVWLALRTRSTYFLTGLLIGVIIGLPFFGTLLALR